MLKAAAVSLAVGFGLIPTGCRNGDHDFQLGTKYFMAQDYSRAEEHYVKALESYRLKEPDNHYIIGKSHGRLASIYILTGEWTAAETQLLFAVEEFGRVPDLGRLELVDAYLTLSQIAQRRDDGEAAKAYLDRAIPVLEKTGNNQLLASVYVGLGNLCSGSGEVREAMEYYGEAKKLYQQAGMSDMIEDIDGRIDNLPDR